MAFLCASLAVVMAPVNGGAAAPAFTSPAVNSVSQPAERQARALLEIASAGACRPKTGKASPRTTSLNSIEEIAKANAAARKHPAPAGFVDAAQIYAYAPGALYELYAAPAYISTILLEAGETVTDIAAGDTARWMVSQSSAGARHDARTLVLVKPIGVNIRTNIVIVTDRRAYLIEAIAAAGRTYSAQIAWTYPADKAVAAASLRGPGSSAALNTNYRIRTLRGAAKPRWTPVAVSDDGRRTWVEFAEDVVAADMPPLFVRTGEGVEIVNYRVQGHRFEIDRLFDVAELRLGVKAPVIVRLERKRPSRSRAKAQAERPS
jgi:type IV secretion system protein VirB9